MGHFGLLKDIEIPKHTHTHTIIVASVIYVSAHARTQTQITETSHEERTLTILFTSIFPSHAASQSRDTQMGPRLKYLEGLQITID